MFWNGLECVLGEDIDPGGQGVTSCVRHVLHLFTDRGLCSVYRYSE